MSEPLKPRLVLRFGVTGHRPPRLQEAQRDRIRESCSDIFAIANEKLGDLHVRNSSVLSRETPSIELVSSLAEGADVLAAEAALANGVQLAACLPFHVRSYAEDFAEHEWRISESLLEQSKSAMVLGTEFGGRDRGYESAGRVVLSQCDILIAVWDGGEARGRGGAAQIVAEAVTAHMPVIHVDATGEKPPMLLWNGLAESRFEAVTPEEVERTDGLLALPAVIDALCKPPTGLQGASLNSFVNAVPRIRWRSLSWPILLALTGAGKWSRVRLPPADPVQSRERLEPYTTRFGSNTPFGAMLNGPALDRYGVADARATQFAMRFRSAFVSNYALASFAVLLALSSLLVPALKLLLITLELFSILLIIGNTHAGRRLNLHASWLDRRYLAERLRMLIISASLGRLGLRDGEDGAESASWVGWYVRATARELGLPNAHLDSDYLRAARISIIELIDEQSSYHRRNAHNMAHANHALHKTGDFLFYGTIVACVLFIISYLAAGGSSAIGGLGLAEIVTFVTALFPALGAALYGIRMQGDFAASSDRSRLIARRLRELKAAIERDPLSYERLVQRTRMLRRILLSEVEQWRAHYESRPLSLPG